MSTWTRLRASAARLFYRQFFRLLLLAASAAQWTVVVWVLHVGLARSFPWWGHVAAIGALYGCNRALTRSRMRRRGRAFRIYAATAFVAMFCSVFLLATAIVFSVAHGVLGVLSAQALGDTAQATLGAGLNDVFHWVASLGMGAIALTMGYGYTFGQRQLRVTCVPVSIPELARPLRIAQISDIHVGQNLTVAQLESFVEQVNAAAPDLICITGDIADSPLADYATFFPILGRLRARTAVCAILGNHDHVAGADDVVAALRRFTTFHVLRDSALSLDVDGAGLHLIGLDDRGRDWARGVQSDARLAELLEAAPRDLPVLLLAHRPDIFHQAAAAGVPLTLSGHTHGGQLAIPWVGGRRRNLAEFVTPFDRGLYRSANSTLYVNAGLGVTGQRIRLFTPREITLFELTPS
jgi:predicted MPP superfamily phosphohydrolase